MDRKEPIREMPAPVIEKRSGWLNDWMNAKVTVHSPEGMVPVPALTHERVPGLAVTAYPTGYFAVTQLRTGRKIGQGYERCAWAMLRMAELGKLFDWTQTVEALTAERDRRKDEPVPFKGYTLTGQGVARPYTLREYLDEIYNGECEGGMEEWDPSDRAAELLGYVQPATYEATP